MSRRAKEVELIAKNIVRIREFLGWTQDDLASKLGMDASTVSRWESGERIPSFPTLIELAEAFGVPVENFFYEEEEMVQPMMRTADVPQEIIVKVQEEIKDRTEKALELLEVARVMPEQPPYWHLPHKNKEEFIKAKAEEFRETNGLTISSSLPELIDTLEDAGVFVSRIPMPSEVSGASIRKGGFGFIFISTKITRERQRFTLMYELAHILFHIPPDGGLQISFRDNFKSRKRPPVESEADTFAGGILIPSELFSSRYPFMKGRKDARQWASLASMFQRETGTSAEAFLTQALKIGWLSGKTYGAARKLLPPWEEPQAEEETLVSPRLMEITRGLLEAQMLTVGQAAFLLKTPHNEFEEFIEPLGGET